MIVTTFLAQQPVTSERILGVTIGSAALVIGLALVFGAVFMFVAALVSILRSPNYTVAGRAMWIFAVLAFPFLGPIIWFAFGRTSTFAAKEFSNAQ